MPTQSGRYIRIQHSPDGGATWNDIAGATEDGATFNAGTIDGTVKTDNGIRTFVDDIELKFLTMTVSGRTQDTDTTLEDHWNQAAVGTSFLMLRFVRPDAQTYTGMFAMPTFEIGAPDGEASTFTATFESTGPVTQSATP